MKRPSHLLTFAPKKLSVHHNPPWKCQTPYDKFGIILQIGWVWCQCSSRTASVYFFHKCKGCSVHDVDKHCSFVAWPSFYWIFPFKTSIYIESYEEQAKATWGWTKDSRNYPRWLCLDILKSPSSVTTLSRTSPSKSPVQNHSGRCPVV